MYEKVRNGKEKKLEVVKKKEVEQMEEDED